MRKHVSSTIAILVMVVLAFGSTNSKTSKTPSGSPTSELSEKSNLEVDRILAQRMRDYEEALAEWNTANEARRIAEIEKDEIQKQIEELDNHKPGAPTFQEREWSTTNEKYRTRAVLVDTNNKSVTLRKQNGKNVTLPKDKLNAEGRLDIEKAFNEMTKYRKSVKVWEDRRKELMDKLASVVARTPSADPPKPEMPKRQEIANEVGAEEIRKSEEARLAAQQIAQEERKANLSQFMDHLSTAGIDSSVIDSVSVDGDTATITVASSWHYSPYQIRLQAAQNLWNMWAKIASPAEPDYARIKLVDYNGNQVGGSRALAGSLIWVLEN